jgi:plastocyanin
MSGAARAVFPLVLGWMMRFPAVLLVIPALAGALLLSGFEADSPDPPPGQVGMSEEEFSTPTVTIKVGEPLTFINNSHFLHVLTPGTDSQTMDQAGMPGMDDAYDTHVSEAGSEYTTRAWNTPGTYHLTCTLHPEMNVDVVVAP